MHEAIDRLAGLHRIYDLLEERTFAADDIDASRLESFANDACLSFRDILLSLNRNDFDFLFLIQL